MAFFPDLGGALAPAALRTLGPCATVNSVPPRGTVSNLRLAAKLMWTFWVMLTVLRMLRRRRRQLVRVLRVQLVVILPLAALQRRNLPVVLLQRLRRVVLLILCVLLRVGGQLSMRTLQIIRISGMRKCPMVRMGKVGRKTEALIRLVKRQRW